MLDQNHVYSIFVLLVLFLFLHLPLKQDLFACRPRNIFSSVRQNCARCCSLARQIGQCLERMLENKTNTSHMQFHISLVLSEPQVVNSNLKRNRRSAQLVQVPPSQSSNDKAAFTGMSSSSEAMVPSFPVYRKAWRRCM